MGMYMAYGVLTAVMAGGMLLVFILRNRMVLWKNRVYLRMLIILLLAVVAELLWRSILPVFLQPNLESEVLFRIFVTICTLFLFYQFFLYDMAVTCKMMLKKTVLFQVFFCIFLLVNAISVISPLYNLTWFYNKNLHNYNLWGYWFICAAYPKYEESCFLFSVFRNYDYILQIISPEWTVTQ